MCGVVFQNDALFADTLRENIDLGRELTDEEIAHGADCAQAKEFIDSLDGGTGYKLAIRGMNLSGGQRQRVLIARALSGHPKILILDDSSSALDYKTDAKLRHAIENDYSDVTSVVIAQRVSSIKNADLILVMDNGKVIGSGTHDELMETCDSYREIALMQMGDEVSA
jgi:ATP-binding cassette subfamily B protein